MKVWVLLSMFATRDQPQVHENTSIERRNVVKANVSRLSVERALRKQRVSAGQQRPSELWPLQLTKTSQATVASLPAVIVGCPGTLSVSRFIRVPSIVLCVAKVHSLDLALALPAHHVQLAHAHSCVGS